MHLLPRLHAFFACTLILTLVVACALILRTPGGLVKSTPQSLKPEVAENASLPASNHIDSQSNRQSDILNRQSVPDPAAQARMVNSYGRLPLSFAACPAEDGTNSVYISSGSGYQFSLSAGEVVLSLAHPSEKPLSRTARLHGPKEAGGWKTGEPADANIRMSMVGADHNAVAEAMGELPGRNNYLIGNDPAKWRTDVRTYEKVLYPGVYPGVDLLYYGNQRQLEYDFIVSPGADPQSIKLAYTGAESIRLDHDGNLVLHTRSGEIRQHRPVLYQEEDSTRQQVNGEYVLTGANQISFKVGEYDRSRPLIIDPVLAYSIYLGGSAFDEALGIAVDGSGNAYVTGDTNSTDFFTTSATQATKGAVIDAFVTKLNSAGTAILYSTYLGGNGGDHGYAIAVNGAGNAYVTGNTTSTNFPTLGAFQSSNAGGTDAFIFELNTAGNGLIFSSYMGGSGDDDGTGITLDSSGNIYAAGYTKSANLLTVNPIQSNNAGGYDAFVMKLNPAGNQILFSTYLGGTGDDNGTCIAVDASGNIYVAGDTNSTDLKTVNAIQPKKDAGADGFVAKLSNSGNQILYLTYLGGNGDDALTSIAVDAAGNLYMTGSTTSTNLTMVNSAQPVKSGSSDSYDVYIAKLNPSGSTFLDSTYLGGSGDEFNAAIAVDSFGNAYVTGQTSSTDFPVSNAVQSTSGGNIDAFVAKLSPTGVLRYSTYLGGSGSDFGLAIAVDSSGNAFVAGKTVSTNFPTFPSHQQAPGGALDAFVAKISNNCSFNLSSSGQTVGPAGTTGSVNVIASSGDCDWAAASNANWITITSNPSGTGNGTVNYTVATSTSQRTGALTIGGQTFTVTQFGATIQFSQSAYSFGEGDGQAVVTVTRTGDASAGASVDYLTTDGTASQSKRYIASIGTLNFAAGETQKTISVLLIDNSYADGNGTFRLTLGNPVGATLGSPSITTVTISDNDNTTAASNPLDDGVFFAREQYLDFLNRPPEAKGLSDWSTYVNGCAQTDYQCQVNTRVVASSGFFRSPEFFSTAYFVMRMYRATLYPRPATGAPPRPTYQDFLRDAPSVKYGVAGDTLAASKLAFAQSWVQRSDFLLMYPAAMSNSDFIDKLAQTAGITLSAADKQALLSLSRAEIVIKIVDNPQVDAREYNAAFVTMQYMGYLRRQPEDKGYMDWLTYLNANPNNCGVMIYGFAFSREYRERFGLYGDEAKFPGVASNVTDCGH